MMTHMVHLKDDTAVLAHARLRVLEVPDKVQHVAPLLVLRPVLCADVNHFGRGVVYLHSVC